MKIVLATYLGIYCQVQTKPPTVLLKGKNMISTKEQNSHQDKSL